MVREIVATITRRGQVTIPVEVRRALGVKPGDEVAFAIEDGQVRLVPVRFTLESAYGSVEPLHRPDDFAVIARRAKDERAERAARSSQ
ncbi:MAG TPA: AbrB/MazE/SpoVT family DNA-binding domain-containing protein [Thermomicrobiales bacterium]|nr:AbrB/MazE/SpoVT family DNA-binding domain-containing protein [Thermomicrobiales bacterium]